MGQANKNNEKMQELFFNSELEIKFRNHFVREGGCRQSLKAGVLGGSPVTAGEQPRPHPQRAILAVSHLHTGSSNLLFTRRQRPAHSSEAHVVSTQTHSHRSSFLKETQQQRWRAVSSTLGALLKMPLPGLHPQGFWCKWSQTGTGGSFVFEL